MALLLRDARHGGDGAALATCCILLTWVFCFPEWFAVAYVQSRLDSALCPCPAKLSALTQLQQDARQQRRA